MRSLCFSLLILSFTACGSELDKLPHNPSLSNDEKVILYSKTFINALGRPLKHVKHISFEDLTDRKTPTGNISLGYANIYSDGMAEIVLNSATWNKLSESSKALVVYHELGHAECGLDHNDNIDHNGDYVSLMTTFVFNVDMTTLHSVYLPRLISQCLENSK